MSGNAKKAVGCGCLIALLLPFVLVFLAFVVPIAVDDIACSAFTRDVKNSIVLPSGAEILEVKNACANSSGTGNHTELVVALLIESDVPLDEDEISEASGMTLFVKLFNDVSDDVAWMSQMGIRFPGQDTADNRYVVMAVKSAPMSWLDIRGM